MAKVDIISGFLGAGKTTFIKKLIDTVYTGEKLVLIENEFGEIGIDGGFLKESGVNIKEINSIIKLTKKKVKKKRTLNRATVLYFIDYILLKTSSFRQPCMSTQTRLGTSIQFPKSSLLIPVTAVSKLC